MTTNSTNVITCHSRESGNPGWKGWIPDQVRNDKLCKVISETVY